MKFIVLPALLLAPCLAIAAAPTAPVRVAKAELRSMAPSVTVAGQVRSQKAADLASAVDGTLAFVAEPGTRVAEHQVVASLDIAELNLMRAERTQRLTRAQIALKSSQRELERMKASGENVSRFQVDQAESARDLAQSDLEIARVGLQQIDERLSRAQFRAPFAGVVVERLKRSGEHASVGDIVARVAGIETLEIRLFVPLRYLGAIAPGRTVTVRREAAAGGDVLAPVHAIVPVGDSRSQSFEVIVEAQGIQPQPAVGTLLSVVLPLAAAAKQAIAVPRDALVIRADGLAVFRVRDGKVQRVPVKTEVADGDWISVESGLAESDTVVVRGGESLHDGDAVQVLADVIAH